MRYRLGEQQSRRLLGTKSCCVQRDHHLIHQRLDVRLAGFARDQPRHFLLLGVQEPLKAAQDLDPLLDPDRLPGRLCGVGSFHCSYNLSVAGAVKLAERLPGRRIHGGNAAGNDLGLSSHLLAD